MDKEILNKYINGSATKSEREIVLRWVASSHENSKELEKCKADWIFEHLPSTSAPEYAVKRLKKGIRNTGNIKNVIIKIAAAFFIPLALLALYQTMRLNVVKNDFVTINEYPQVVENDTLVYNVHFGVKGLVDLPDGSKVWLNSGSSLKCPVKFAGDKRDVLLVGEGYFIVKGDPEWPMFVKTKRNITVKVTGTEFNITSYANDKELKLTLVKGNVTILNANDNTETTVSPMEEIIIPDMKSSQKHKSQADIHVNTAWKEGSLLFDNTPMEQVLKRMERWYGVSFLITDSTILNNNFTAEFKSESLTQVLDYIKKSSFLSYKIENTIVTLYKL